MLPLPSVRSVHQEAAALAVLAFFPVPSLRNVHKLSPRRLPSAPLLHLVIVILLLRAGSSAGLRGPLVASARTPALLGLAPFIAPLALRSPHIRLCAFRWRAGSLAAHRAGCLARSASASRSLWYVGPYCCAASSFRIMCVCEEPALFNNIAWLRAFALCPMPRLLHCLVRPGVGSRVSERAATIYRAYAFKQEPY